MPGALAQAAHETVNAINFFHEENETYLASFRRKVHTFQISWFTMSASMEKLTRCVSIIGVGSG